MASGYEKSPDYGSQGGWLSNIVAALVVVAIAAAFIFFGPPAEGQRAALIGVASVIDGDTIEIHGQRVRLSGYDSPERGKMCGQTNVYQRASLALSNFIGTRTVNCTLTGARTGNRMVGVCSVGGVDLGEHIVSQGWARDWPRYSNGAYADEESGARTASRGIWGLQCPADLWGTRDYSR